MRLYVDLRCLQDPLYAFRGVGMHSASVLRHARDLLPRPLEIVGILDETLPDLPAAHAGLVDQVQRARTPSPGPKPVVFLQTSPMTHDPATLAPFVGHRHILSCALVYDFIPLDEPRYLPTPEARRRYLAGLYWLKLHQLFYPISHYSGTRLQQVVEVPPGSVAVTGASVRATFADFDASRVANIAHRSRFAPGRYFLMVGGNDERKNAACALNAHARLLARDVEPVGLVVAGHYLPAFREQLLAGYLEAGGRIDRVEFLDDVADEELAALYHRAIATLCPSRIEGFSLPVVEAIACGCPVLASSNDAHRELVEQPEALYAPNDPAGAAAAMERMLRQPGWRGELLGAQAPVAPRFREQEVAGRVWRHVMAHLPGRAPGVVRQPLSRPRLAILSPYPPDRSGVADYTAHSLQSLSRHATLDVFTDAAQPRPDRWVRQFHPISDLAYLQDEYDRVLSVVGNSSFHTRIIDLHNRYGGPCLVHDNRLAEVYACVIGLPRFLDMVRKVIGRDVEAADIAGWLHNPATLPSLCFDEVLVRAEPLLVHSRGIQAQLAKRYGAQARYLPFCCYRHFRDEELTPEARRAARERLRVSPDRLLIISLGIVDRVKGAPECLWAMELLQAWGIPAELHFVGEAGGWRKDLDALLDRLEIEDRVRLGDAWISDEVYRDYLLAADFAIQLRTHAFGGLSGAVLDTLAAGLPTVLTTDMAMSMEAPDYGLTIPDHLSALLLAECLVEAIRTGKHHERRGPGRDAYVEQHSFQRYAVEMMKALDFPVSGAA